MTQPEDVKDYSYEQELQNWRLVVDSQRCAGRLQWMSLGLGDGTAEALRCQPGIVDAMGI